jgi:hypothetical protein
MKKLQLLLIAFLLTSAVMAQLPQAINYQAVARNNAGVALASQTIKVRLSIVRNSVSQYSETRQVTTNALGLFNVQIGSGGTLVTSGSFTGINWTNNPQPLMLKVELDISNSGTFTDMGSQTFATVPYSFTAGEAINAINIGGKYVDTNTPATGDLLKWNGTAWAPAAAPAQPVIHSVAGQIPDIASGGGGGAPWVMAGPNSAGGGYATVTLTEERKIVANFVGVFRHANANPQPCSFSVCYEPVVNGVPTGVITSFQGNYYTDGTVSEGNTYNKTTLSATGARSFPAGTYRIFMGIKNKSANVNFNANDYVNGTVIVF